MKIIYNKSSLKFNWKILTVLAGTATLFVFTFLITPAFAAPELAIMGKPVVDIVSDAISWLITVVVILAIMMVVVGGIAYIFSSGDPQRAAFARKIILWALGGLMITGFAYAIIVLIEKIVAP